MGCINSTSKCCVDNSVGKRIEKHFEAVLRATIKLEKMLDKHEVNNELDLNRIDSMRNCIEGVKKAKTK